MKETKHILSTIILPLFFLGAFFFNLNANAQFVSATLGINGLTCSLCSYNVEKELRKTESVDSVKMDLNANIAKIIFKKDIPVRMNEVVNAVYKAGFSVGYTQASFFIDNINIESGDNSFTYLNDKYQFVNVNNTLLKGIVILKFVDKKFVTPKESKHWEKIFKSEKIRSSTNTTVYHIIL